MINMKMNIIRINTFLIALLVFWACDSDDEQGITSSVEHLNVSKSEVKLDNMSGSYTINVEATGEWTAEVTEAVDGWLTLSKTNGVDNGDLRLFFTENKDGAKREGKIKVALKNAANAIEQEISVEQLGSDPDILLEYSEEKVSFQGGPLICRVVANVPWKVVINGQYDWITEKTKQDADAPMIRATTDEIQFEIALNTSVERKGEVEIVAVTGYVLSKKMKIVQEAIQTTLELEQDEYIIPFKCKTLPVTITQEYPIPYEVTASEDWVVLNTESSNDESVVLNIKDNTTFFPRTATVTVKNSVEERKFTVFQYGRPDTSIGDDQSEGKLLAFPGAEGGGRYTIGGRGGVVYRVTNLEDYAASETPIKGSLRYGIEEVKGPRTIIFDVSGIIEMKRSMSIAGFDTHLSIIGQTAPGDGITMKNYNFTINLARSNVGPLHTIIRFMHFRPGDKYSDYGEDGVGGRNFEDVIVDHVTASWSVDETFTAYGVKNYTGQWCMASESLNYSNHAKGHHGYAGMFGGTNATFHHMLLAHHSSRIPRLIDGKPCDIRNNVYYNWGERWYGCYGGEGENFNIVNCYYKAGPATGTGPKSWRIWSTAPYRYDAETGDFFDTKAYINGNYVTANDKTTSDNWTTGVWKDQIGKVVDKQNPAISRTPTEEEMRAMKMDVPFPFSKVTTHSAEQAYEKVLEYAGASLRRDAVDRRIVEEVRKGIAPHMGTTTDDQAPGIIDTPSDVGGYPEVKSLKPWPDTDGDGIPDIWEEAYGLDPNNPEDAKEISTSVDPNGRYPNLEVYFHNLVQHIIYHQNLGGVPKEKK